MGFLDTLFTGNNDTLNKLQSNYGQQGGVATKLGTNDTSTASDFFHSILSGGGSKYLAPQTDAYAKQGSGQLMNLSQFGNRSGGTNSEAQQVGDHTRASTNDLYSSLSSGAATGLENIGVQQQQLGLENEGQEDQVTQQIQQNQANSILGKGISSAVGAAESFGLGAGFNALSPDLFSTMSGKPAAAKTTAPVGGSPFNLSSLTSMTNGFKWS